MGFVSPGRWAEGEKFMRGRKRKKKGVGGGTFVPKLLDWLHLKPCGWCMEQKEHLQTHIHKPRQPQIVKNEWDKASSVFSLSFSATKSWKKKKKKRGKIRHYLTGAVRKPDVTAFHKNSVFFMSADRQTDRLQTRRWLFFSMLSCFSITMQPLNFKNNFHPRLKEAPHK